jgi:hypothetical protein
VTYADCQRFSVLRSERQPYILGIDAKADPYNILAQPFCPDTSSFTFTQTELTNYASLHTLTFGTTYFTNVSTFTVRVVLTDTTFKRIYRIPLQITDEYYGSWYDLKIQTKWFEGRYPIDSGVSPGNYRLSLEYIDKSTAQSTMSEPYERIIRVN